MPDEILLAHRRQPPVCAQRLSQPLDRTLGKQRNSLRMLRMAGPVFSNEESP